MKRFVLLAALFTAGSFLFAGAASAQPAPGWGYDAYHNQNWNQCDCIGYPGCPCDPGAPAPRQHQHAAPQPTYHHHGPAIPPPPAQRTLPPIPTLPPPPLGMQPDAFKSLISSMEAQPFSEDKLKIVRHAANTNEFSCSQVRTIMKQFSFDKDRVSAAAMLYKNVADPENWFSVYGELTFSSSKDQLEAMTRP